MYKLILWKTDDTVENFDFKEKPTFQQMYPLIDCSIIERSSGFDKNISNRTFDMWFDEEGGPMIKGVYDKKDNPKGAIRNKRATIAWYLWQKRTGHICQPGDAIHGNVAIIKKVMDIPQVFIDEINDRLKHVTPLSQNEMSNLWKEEEDKEKFLNRK